MHNEISNKHRINDVVEQTGMDIIKTTIMLGCSMMSFL